MSNDIPLKSNNVELIGLSISMCARAINTIFNKSLKRYGVSMSQIHIMYAISEYRGYHMDYIAKKLVMYQHSLKLCIQQMPQYIQFHKDPADRRAVYPALTEEGAKLLKKMMPKVLKIEESFGVIAKDKDKFIDYLSKFNKDVIKLRREAK